jgi:uncharacterized protein YcfJ
MNIKPVVILGIAVSVVSATPVLADHGYRGGAYARVVAVEPILRRVVVEQPRQACWDDVAYRSAQPGRVAASTIAGGVLGGTIGQAVGNNIGHGQSRAVLGLLGANRTMRGDLRASESAARGRILGHLSLPRQT